MHVLLTVVDSVCAGQSWWGDCWRVVCIWHIRCIFSNSSTTGRNPLVQENLLFSNFSFILNKFQALTLWCNKHQIQLHNCLRQCHQHHCNLLRNSRLHPVHLWLCIHCSWIEQQRTMKGDLFKKEYKIVLGVFDIGLQVQSHSYVYLWKTLSLVPFHQHFQ